MNSPSLTLDLQISESLSESDDHPPPENFHFWVRLAIGEKLSSAELTIRLADEAEITKLNHSYRNKNQATNILSFSASLPEYIDIPLLGDIVICPAIVKKESIEQQKTADAHWAHLVIHGTLHLLGYDHIEESEAEKMESLEIQLLSTLGIRNPYEEKHY